MLTHRVAIDCSQNRTGTETLSIDHKCIPFAKRRHDGAMVDAYAVKRGLECDCVCPSCSAQLIARQGSIREWHFAHATKNSGVENVCDYSALVSIRLVAQQLLAEATQLTLPPGPFEERIAPRDVPLESIKIDTRFEGFSVDAMAMIKSVPLAICMTSPSRQVPDGLFTPRNAQAGVIEIDVTELWQVMRASAGRRTGKSDLAAVLINDAAVKKWVYHPVKRKPIESVQWQSILSPRESLPVPPLAAPKASAASNHPVDHSPLLQRFRCEHCLATWYAGSSEMQANFCVVCKLRSGKVIP